MKNNISKIKLMIIYHSGMAKASQKIFEEFSKNEFIEKILVLVPKRMPTEKIFIPSGFLELRQTIRKDNLTIKPVNFLKWKSHLINPVSVLINVLKFKPSVILVFNEGYSGDLFSVSLIRGIVSIFGLKPEIFFYQFENINKYKICVEKKIAAWFIKKNVKYGFFCSEGAKKALNQSGWFPKLKNIWWGVDIKHFQKYIPKEEIITLKNKIGLPLNHKVIGFVGRFIEEKGVRDLVEAFLKIDIPSTLLLVGDGPEIEYLKGKQKEVTDRNKQIIILPPQDFTNMPIIYRLIDILILPSKSTNYWKEQYGRVLIEAMASGIPVVGSNSGAIPEVIDGMGSIFEEGNIENLGKAISNELNNFSTAKKKQFQEYARKGSVENFVKEIVSFIIFKK